MNTKTLSRKLLTTFLLLALMALPAAAQTKEANQARQAIMAAAQKINTLQCDFTQTKQLRMLNNKLTSRGRMYYQKSDRLRWEYASPYQFTFLLNGNQALTRQGGKTKMIATQQSKTLRQVSRIMMSSVVGDCLSNTRDFKVTLKQVSGQWQATLVPQRGSMKQMFRSIRLTFHKKSRQVTSVLLTEKNGDTTLIELHNPVTNKTIDAKIFALH